MWINALVGGVAGALVALLLPLILKRTRISEEKKKTVHQVAIVVAAIGAATLLGPTLRLEYALHQASEELLKNPAIAALQRHEPNGYAEIMTAIRGSLRAGKTVGEAQTAGREILSQYITPKLAIASNSAVANYMTVMIREIRELHAGGDEACYTFLFAGSGPSFDVTKRISAATIDADQRALAALLESAATSPQPRVDPKTVEKKVESVVARLIPKYGNDFVLLDKPQTALANKRRVCELTADLYSEILGLPLDDSGPILRSMLSS